MYSLQDAPENITLDEIFSKVSEYELWKYYCTNFEELDKSFRSELYNDKNPSCRIFKTNLNKLQYKDFGTGNSYSIINYIQVKYLCSFKDCLNIISKDFNLTKSSIIIEKQTRLLTYDETIINKPKARIDIISQPFNIVDFNYWDKYKISLELLDEYNVFSAKHVYLTKNDKITIFNYTKQKPIYAYRFCTDNEYSYKIYMPYNDKKYKWLFSGGSQKDIEGIDQLSLNGDILILTKSLKDCISYRLCGYDAISLQGETNKLNSELVNRLLNRFNTIIVQYDNDPEGIKGSIRLNQQYGFKYFFINNAKDLSDYLVNNTIKDAKLMIDNKIKQLILE